MKGSSLFGLGLLAIACSEPTPQKAAPSASVDQFAELRRLEERVAFERLALKNRLAQEIEIPRRTEAKCPDSLALALKAPKKRRLVVRVNDARALKRDLLALRFTSQIESQELEALERYYTPGTSPNLIKRPLRSEKAGRSALKQLGTIKGRPYAGVVHVTSYIAPRRVLKVGRRHPEWLQGWVFGRFVIHHIDNGEALCGFSMEIKNDVSEAPLARRLREQTRHKLVIQLGQRVRASVAERLSELHPLLSLPSPTPG